MTAIKYTKEQISELQANKYVKNCTEKHIVFHTAFKLLAVKEIQDFLTPQQIFRKYGFPEYVIQTDTPSNALDRWKRNFKKKWRVEESKWKPKKIDFSNMTLEQENEYLKAKVAYLEEIQKYIEESVP